MITAPVLRAPDWASNPTHPFILVTDASGFGMGACLMQRDKNDPDAPPRPIGYWSRHLNALERRVLATHERELCALMEGLEFFDRIIVGYSLEVWCDHRPLEHFWTQPHITGKQGRWAGRIARYLPFAFVYVPGKDPAMAIPDALSRKMETGYEKAPLGSLQEATMAKWPCRRVGAPCKCSEGRRVRFWNLKETLSQSMRSRRLHTLRRTATDH